MRLSGTLARSISTSRGLGNPLWDLAGSRPSIDLRFDESKNLVDAVSGTALTGFTRASGGTYVGSDGMVKAAETNEPRFTHNPATGESLGLLVEESRTNSIRNNTMVGAVTGTPGTLPTNWVIGNSADMVTRVASIASENGISYIDLEIAGSPTSSQYVLLYENVTQVSAANGQVWSSTFYVKTIAGSQANISFFASRLRFGSATGSLTEIFDTTIQPSPSTMNLANTRTGSASAAASALTERVTSGIVLNFTATGVATTITLRIGLPQLEQGAFATSVIPTAGTAITRAADVLTDTTRGAAIRSLYAEFRSPAFGTRPIVSIDDDTANERITLLTNGADPKLLVVDDGITQADLDAGSIAANTTARLAARFDTNNFAASVSGGAEVTDTTGTMPTVNRIRIGHNQAGNCLNGTIARIAGWDSPLPALSTITQ